MILGIGTDIIETERIKKAILKSERFKNRVFTSNEQEYCESRKSSYEHYAARYAAKEACFKAFGTGWRGELKFTDIEVVNDKLGKPDLILTGEALKFIESNNANIFLSLSHIKDVSVAYVVIEKNTQL